MLLLVSGQSASGKSEYAESRAMALAGRKPQAASELAGRTDGDASVYDEKKDSALIYMAAMMPFREEAQKRIERHHQLRAGKGFETIERYTDLEGLLQDEACREKLTGATVLLECMSNLTANELYTPEMQKETDLNRRRAQVETRILKGIKALLGVCEHLVVVTLDVYGEGLVYDDETECFRETLGAVSGKIAAMADEVVQVIYGIPDVLKSQKS